MSKPEKKVAPPSIGKLPNLAEAAKPPVVVAPVVESAFVIEDVALPNKTRASRPSLYPFDALAVGQSFFIAGKTAKEMASTVGSANKRHSKPDPEGGVRVARGGKEVPKTVQERKFDAVNDTKDGIAGVRVGRVL